MTYVFPFLAGLFAFLSPCIIPMITVYISLITGFNLEQLTSDVDASSLRKTIFPNTIFFIIGFGLIFTIAGGAAGFAGSLLKKYYLTLNYIGGTLIILFGIYVILKSFLKMPNFVKFNFRQKLKLENKPAGFFGSFSVGVFYAIACSHCIASILTAVLIYAGTTGSVSTGAFSLTIFSAGLAIPYLITALAITLVLGYLKKIKRYLWLVSLLSGIFLIFFGILLLTNQFTAFTGFFSKYLPYNFPGGM